MKNNHAQKLVDSAMRKIKDKGIYSSEGIDIIMDPDIITTSILRDIDTDEVAQVVISAMNKKTWTARIIAIVLGIVSLISTGLLVSNKPPPPFEEPPIIRSIPETTPPINTERSDI